MTFEEIQKTLETMLTVQRELQETQIKQQETQIKQSEEIKDLSLIHISEPTRPY